MKAITIVPGKANSVALDEVDEPVSHDGTVLVRGIELGICGTDFELISGEYGTAPPDSAHLVLGHESLGQVQDAPAGSGFERGDLVVGVVRRPDPVPCVTCAAGEWDMCRNGAYTERGIKERHGFGAERWRIEPEFAIKVESDLRSVGVLLEPASVLAKAWQHLERIGERAHWRPRTLLVTGAGPIGLLAAMMGQQRGLEVHVLDQVSDGPKPKLVEDLGARYYTDSIGALGFSPDIIIECTGATPVMQETLRHMGSNTILCMVGSSAHGQTAMIDVAQLNRALVLGNGVVFGVVNANRAHYELAVAALRKANATWLKALITRREKLTNWRAAFERRRDDVKVVIELVGTT